MDLKKKEKKTNNENKGNKIRRLNLKFYSEKNNYNYNIERFNDIIIGIIGEQYTFPLDILNSNEICYNK